MRRIDGRRHRDAYIEAGRLGVTSGPRHLPRRARKTRSRPEDRRQGDKKAACRAAEDRGRRQRRKMPRERESITHKFSVGMHEGYITAGKYDDGTVGEIFLTDIGKEGSTLRGMMNAFATAVSIGLQYGVPLEVLVSKFSYMRFDPEGITNNPEIPFAKSMPDYIMRWLGSRFIDDLDELEDLGILTPEVLARKEAQQRCSPTRDRPRQRRRDRHPAPRGQARRVGHDRHPAGPPGPHGRPRPGPGVLELRRHDAAHGLVLHVLELRQQHRLRLSRSLSGGTVRRRRFRWR
jgi:hypothetical protein